MRGASGDWEISNVTIENSDYHGIDVQGADGDWRIRNVTIRDGEGGIRASNTTGDWRIEDTVIRNISLSDGVYARWSSGDWTMANVTVDDPQMIGLEASTSTGDWRVVNSTFRNAPLGIGAFGTSGNWTVSRSTVANISTTWRVRFVKPPHEQGVGVFASKSNGAWTLRGNRFVDNEVADVVADDAAPAGDARQNWWGDAAGPDADDCTGNVDCGDPLSSWPPDSEVASPSSTPTSTQTATDAPTADADPATAEPTETRTDGDGSTTEADDDAASTDDDPGAAGATPSTPTPTAADGPLSPLLTLVGLLLGGLVAGRRRNSRP